MTNRVRFLFNLRCSTHIHCHSFSYLLENCLDLCAGHVGSLCTRNIEEKMVLFYEVAGSCGGRTRTNRVHESCVMATSSEADWINVIREVRHEHITKCTFIWILSKWYACIWIVKILCLWCDLCAVCAGRRSLGYESRSNGNKRYRKTFSTLLFAAFDLARAPSVWVHYAVCHIVNKVFRVLTHSFAVCVCIRYTFSVLCHIAYPHRCFSILCAVEASKEILPNTFACLLELAHTHTHRADRLLTLKPTWINCCFGLISFHFFFFHLVFSMFFLWPKFRSASNAVKLHTTPFVL